MANKDLLNNIGEVAEATGLSNEQDWSNYRRINCYVKHMVLIVVVEVNEDKMT